MTGSGIDPTPLRDSLDEVLRGLRGGPSADSAASVNGGGVNGGGVNGGGVNGGGEARSLGSLFNRWAEAVGQSVADHARPIKLDGGRLLVEVDEPGWATQLKFLEREVIDRLRAVAGLEVSRFDVRVKQR